MLHAEAEPPRRGGVHSRRYIVGSGLRAGDASRGGGAQTAVIDVDENDTAEGIDLPGADLSGEELMVIVVPEQSDEFTCSSCFLVRHRSQVAREKNGMKYCRDCEG